MIHIRNSATGKMFCGKDDASGRFVMVTRQISENEDLLAFRMRMDGTAALADCLACRDAYTKATMRMIRTARPVPLSKDAAHG
jgi:hypothetical protein